MRTSGRRDPFRESPRTYTFLSATRKAGASFGAERATGVLRICASRVWSRKARAIFAMNRTNARSREAFTTRVCVAARRVGPST